jgi:hypothetical protein
MKPKSQNKDKKVDKILAKIRDPEDREIVKDILAISLSPDEEKALIKRGSEKIKQNPEKYKKIVKSIKKLQDEWEKDK